MQLTPNEMRNQQFTSAMRGYNKAEVDSFRENAANALEEAKTQVLKLTNEQERLSSKYAELKNLEETIKTAVMEAQKNGEQIIRNARKEAELIIKEAKQQRDRIIDEMHKTISGLESKIHELELAKKSFYTKLHAEIEGHLKLVDSIYPQVVPTPQERHSHEENRDQNQPPSAVQHHQETAPIEHSAPPVEPKNNRPERPHLDMPDEEIDRIVDQFGEVSQEEEEVKHGQPEGRDF